MGPFLLRIRNSLFGIGLSRRQRILRTSSAACLAAAAVLLVTAGILATNESPTKRKLPTGTVFNVPLVAATTVVPSTASVTSQPTPSPLAATPTPADQQPTDTPVPQPWPTPEPTSPPSEAAVAKIMIPAIKVNAPISYKGVDKSGVMQDPNSWNDVAYYNFSGRPGFGPGNNAVFAGHVDYYPHRSAVFWDLDKLKPGDEIRVVLADQAEFTYKVTQMVVYNADKAPVQEILGETPNETVTIITCNGSFVAGEYNNRLVVRAERKVDTPAAQPQAGG